MRILIVENDTNKSTQVELFLHDEIELKSCDIDIRRSFQSGLEAILVNSYDLLILDMSIPTFDISEIDDGGETLDRGGEIILQEMEREGIKMKSIILTQYEEFDEISLQEIDDSLKKEFSDFYLGCIYYNTSQVNWQNDLKNIISKFE